MDHRKREELKEDRQRQARKTTGVQGFELRNGSANE